MRSMKRIQRKLCMRFEANKHYLFRSPQEPDFVKVLDFGIAKVLDQDTEHTPLTREGIVCGTPAFIVQNRCRGCH